MSDANRDLAIMEQAGGQNVAVYDEHLARNTIDEDEIDLRALWRIVLRYKKLIALIFFVIVLTALVITLLMRPMYTASASLEINTSGRSLVSFDNVQDQNVRDWRYLSTQTQVLWSYALAEQVVKNLDLVNEPEFNGELKQRGLMNGLRSLINVFRASDDEPSEADAIVSATWIYLGRLGVGQVGDTSVVNISFSTFDYYLAAKIANEHAKAYISLSDERRFNSTSGAKEFLETEIATVQAKLETSEKQLNDFARKNGVIDVEDRNNIMMERLSDLNSSLSMVQSERIDAETKALQANSANAQTLASVNDDLLIKALQEQQVTLKAEYLELSRIYKPKYPAMVQLEAKINELEANIRSQSSKILGGLTSNFEQLQLREELLNQELDELKEEMLNLQDRAVTYNILKREWEANRQLYAGLLERTKEVGVAAGMELNVATIVDSADVSTYASSPNLKLNLMLASFLGLISGLGVAFLLAMLDNTINEVEQLEQVTKLSHLGVAPKIDLSNSAIQFDDEDQAAKNRIMDTLLHHDGSSAFAESIQSVRTSLSFVKAGGFPQSIMLTSSLQGEGKSTVSLNLAISCANAGKRVLVIEADMRRSRLYKVFGVPLSPGLSDHLVESSPAVPYRVSQIPNLSVLVAGSKTPNPVDLLGSSAMKKLVDDYQNQYDLVIIDSPPVLMLADSIMLSRYVESVLFVVAAHSTPKDAIKNSLERLRMVQAPLIGTVLNKVDVGFSGYDYQYLYELDEGKSVEVS